jgi:hypothetical protein
MALLMVGSHDSDIVLKFSSPGLKYFIATLMLGHLHNLLSRTMYLYIRLVLSICNLVLPHWDTIRRTRERIRRLLDIHIIKHETVFNNTCYSLSLADIVGYVCDLLFFILGRCIRLMADFTEFSHNTGAGQPICRDTHGILPA